MIHFGLDPGKLVRWLGGKYTGAQCNMNRTLTAVKDHVSTDDLSHMKRILLEGSPCKLTFNKPLANESLMIQRGNLKSFNKNPELVLKTKKQGIPLQPRPPPRQTIMRILSTLPPYNSNIGNQAGEE